jgi:hypoxanthine-guanine phosphoribosyltransferase
MVEATTMEFSVKDKKVLVIDDDVATGTTLSLVKSTLLEHGASSVTTASISNHFLPDEIKVDYSVYKYKLLRTKNSRDYYAT